MQSACLMYGILQKLATTLQPQNALTASVAGTKVETGLPQQLLVCRIHACKDSGLPALILICTCPSEVARVSHHDKGLGGASKFGSAHSFTGLCQRSIRCGRGQSRARRFCDYLSHGAAGCKCQKGNRNSCADLELHAANSARSSHRGLYLRRSMQVDQVPSKST